MNNIMKLYTINFSKLPVNFPSFNDQLTIKTRFSHTLNLVGDKVKYTARTIITFLY